MNILLKLLFKTQKYKTIDIRINDSIYKAKIADNFIKRAAGLMFFPKLGKNDALLIYFGREFYPGIWMYNMKFPIDIVWLDSEFFVADFKEMLAPCSSIFKCKVYYPSSKARYVLEMPTGTIKKEKIKKRSKIKI
ncbi:MAG: DUF192 domain-containing protein [Candidatus Micrarchaeia archaeon]